MAPKPLKVGVRQGAGPEPGYEWSVGIIDAAYGESIAILSEAGYTHFAMQVKEIAREPDPTRCDTVDIRPIEDFFEIRDHGGVLGNINVRVFYGVDRQRRVLIVLGAIKKQNSGSTPLGDKVRIRRRWRKYLKGDYGFLE